MVLDGTVPRSICASFGHDQSGLPFGFLSGVDSNTLPTGHKRTHARTHTRTQRDAAAIVLLVTNSRC